MSDNPYSAPEAEIIAQEIKLRGGYFAVGGTDPLQCSNALLSRSGGYLRLAYIPAWCLPISLILHATLTVLMIPFLPTWTGLGFLFYIFIYSAFCVTKIRNVEFDLEEETFILDRRRKRLGLQKRLDGRSYFLGLFTKGVILEEVVDALPSFVEGEIKTRSKMNVHLFALLIWIVGGMIAGPLNLG